MDYMSDRWLRKREAILKRDGYLCRESKRYGKKKDATTVHHIYPVEFYPELMYTNWNLISLTNGRHNTMHDRDSHEITEIGKQWQQRRKKEFDEWMENKNKLLIPPL